MKEDFLQFVWQYRLFDLKSLSSTEGEAIEILHTGHHNLHSGPDFQHAKIKIANVEWHGHVEIHIRSSDWARHRHSGDSAYENVILHVVWTDDKAVINEHGKPVPTLELKNRVSENIIFRYNNLVEAKSAIPCQATFGDVDNISKLSQFENAGMQRLERKANEVMQLLEARKGDWEETTYSLLCKNFGFKVNSEAFLTLSERLPLSVLRKERHRIIETEALLFGMSGLLQGEEIDAYHGSLQRTYRYLAHKHKLSSKEMSPTHWRYMRMRPANFPTVRMAQLAMLLHHHMSIFSFFKEKVDTKELLKIFSVEASTYWQKHYRFGKESESKSVKLGQKSIENILINTMAPLLVAYGKYCDEQIYIDRAVGLLESLKAEKNNITEKWADLGQRAAHAFDSQSMIEQYNEFCEKRNCLKCKIGVLLMK